MISLLNVPPLFKLDVDFPARIFSWFSNKLISPASSHLAYFSSLSSCTHLRNSIYIGSTIPFLVVHHYPPIQLSYYYLTIFRLSHRGQVQENHSRAFTAEAFELKLGTFFACSCPAKYIPPMTCCLCSRANVWHLPRTFQPRLAASVHVLMSDMWPSLSFTMFLLGYCCLALIQSSCWLFWNNLQLAHLCWCFDIKCEYHHAASIAYFLHCILTSILLHDLGNTEQLV